MSATETLRHCPHCGSTESPRVLRFRLCPYDAHVQVVCEVKSGGCGSAGPREVVPEGRAFKDFEPAAIAGWNVRADDHEEFERIQRQVREAVERRDAVWRAKWSKVLAPSAN